MGVPAFYRWLVDKYPLIVEDAVEEEPVVIDGAVIPVDTAKPNPNNLEYDNLYLDINGIIYLCLHPEDCDSPTSFDQVFQFIFNYIDRLFGMVRPRKLLYLAFDGVAPRAKMNEQRCRRFRAAKDAADAAAEEEKLRREFERQGRMPPAKKESQVYYSHVIAPGTEFMAALSAALKYYIHLRLNYDIGWKGIKVILSDANVPGEGEHKIMSYIRLQRNLPGYDPNTRHCVYGLDADLITLALATHEVHFSILRKVVFTPGKHCHLATDCKGKGKRKAGEFDEKGDAEVGARKPYQFLHVWRLREYLECEMRIPNLPIEIDFERIVDDFVFMCFFLGNDFLPRMPTLEIWEGAVNLLLAVYKKEFMALGDYLIDSSKPNLSSVEHFIQAVGSYEDNIFQKRAQLNKRQAEKFKAQIKRGDVSQVQPESPFQGTYHASVPSPSPFQLGQPPPDDKWTHLQAEKVAHSTLGASIVEAEMRENQNELKTKLKKLLREKSDTFSADNPEEDRVKLGEPGWKERYYKDKFSAEELDAVRNDVVAKYIEGLCWVTHYYYEGVCSWQWFYPYHYAPFASDLKDLGQLKINFKLGSPFKPFTQMLGVSPAASSHALPEQYRKLMTDPNSPITDFYPTDFEVDTNGKRYSWQGIAKLPFIDEARLLAEVAKIEHTLTDEEVQRNSVTFDMLFVSSSHTLSPYVYYLENRSKRLTTNKEKGSIEVKLNPRASIGMNGYISLSAGDPCSLIFRSPIQGKEDIVDNQVLCVIYRLPHAHKHITRLPGGVIFPKRTVTIGDEKPEPVLRHQDCGTRPVEIGRQSLKPIAEHWLQVNSLLLKTYNQPASYQNNWNGYGYGACICYPLVQTKPSIMLSKYSIVA